MPKLLKLKEAIRNKGIQYLPPKVVDADELGLSDGEIDWLVRRGTAEHHIEPAQAQESVSESLTVADVEPQGQAEDAEPVQVQETAEPQAAEDPAQPAAAGKKRSNKGSR